MSTTIALAIAAVTGLIGAAIGYVARRTIAQGQLNSIEAKAKKIIDDAKTKEREALLSAKDKAMKIVDEAKREEQKSRNEFKSMIQRIEKREVAVENNQKEIEATKQKLVQKIDAVEKHKNDLAQVRQEAIDKLQTIAGLTKEEALEQMYGKMEKQYADDLAQRMFKLQKRNTEEFELKAKKILTTVMQRYAGSHSAETTTTTVELPSEDMKGRIIGKEGRNIKTLEKVTGCELIIDDTPGAITISGFSPIRRQIARITLEKLLEDGRIQPARIEETIELAKKELALDIKKAGEEMLYEMGLTGFDPKLTSILGRLKYRTSYGQNNMMHSLEVAHLCGMMAGELGMDVTLAKTAGLFHDIGKSIDHENDGGHPELGYALMKKFNVPEEIAYCSIAHHEDNPKTLLGAICKAADALSGARPGARKGTYEFYIKRLEGLENVATSFPGVEKAYAISAGREVRVFVHPSKVDDYAAHTLARDIAHKIEQELQYPGEIRVTVIREQRVIELAR